MILPTAKPRARAIASSKPLGFAVRWFSAALYDPSPWRALAVETAWLVGIGAVFGLLARLGMRRLAT